MPETEAERNVIREQLERILVSPLFKHSKRYPNLLRYVVEQSLEGHAAELKERTLGIEVFGREPHYDTNADPVVRTTAGEIRKRLAQYYYESAHFDEIRIDLPSGSYVPEFHVSPSTHVETLPIPVLSASSSRPKFRYAAAVAIILLIAAGLLWRKPWKSQTALDQFWGPVLESPSSILLCAGQRLFFASLPENQQQGPEDFDRLTPRTSSSTAPVTLFDLYYLGSQNVAIPDVITLGRLEGLLQAKGKESHIRGKSSTTFTDLRNGSVVLVGAFNNDWTMRLTGPLRFSFERDDNTFWIKDRENPSKKNRAVNYAMPYLKLTQDYALISRVLDRTTDRMVVVVGGLTGYGTMAAGEFLANPGYMEAIAASAPIDWARKNVQLVIAADVINGVSGPPRILETHFW